MPAKHSSSSAQLTFDWSAKLSSSAEVPAPNPTDSLPLFDTVAQSESTVAVAMAMPGISGLVQALPWDFRTTFPEPLEEAIESGKLHEDDVEFENLRALHEEHANHALMLLSDLHAVMDARRAGVDPRTGAKPRTPKQQEALQKLFEQEPKRLEHAFEVLIDVYEEAFGAEAADAFRKAIRARHAGVEVISELPPTPTPLPTAVNQGVFGFEEDGAAVNPGLDEVRDILENVTDAIGEMPEGNERNSLLAKCAEDFGSQAIQELDRWSKLKTQADGAGRTEYDPGHPWHYYHEGDGAEPLPVAAIPARPTTLERLGIKVPKTPAKRQALFQKFLADQRRQLAEDEQRYKELIEWGAEALSEYDREIAYAGDDDLAWASAVALKFNHIGRGRGRVSTLEDALGLPNIQAEPAVLTDPWKPIP